MVATLLMRWQESKVSAYHFIQGGSNGIDHNRVIGLLGIRVLLPLQRR